MSKPISLDRNAPAGECSDPFKRVLPAKEPRNDITTEYARLDVTIADENGVLINRPWLRVGVDRRTRECVSITVFPDKPSMMSATPVQKTRVEHLLGRVAKELRPVSPYGKNLDRKGNGGPSITMPVMKGDFLKLIADIFKERGR